ncbi:hypothetical protein [Haloarcula sebkhae]|uniref:Uncharacterized protein n=2 Tax=Haloarcula sebkhae TaxID=932660 RepID=A0ACC6VNI1_9EURY|nr:hypothetical protein [Haloarcula sebkhae]GGK82829.1 hypothetical protein GCM10009067_38830 [Haloarcula sebkhae]
MANSRRSRSSRKGEDANVSYSIATPFTNKDATIFLFDNDDGTVEVLIGDIPTPSRYYKNYQTDDREKHYQHGVARWILDDAGRELKQWDYSTSSSKSRNPNYYLCDVYFECDEAEVNEAVLAAKRFLTTLEEKVVMQKQQFGSSFTDSPQQALSSR